MLLMVYYLFHMCVSMRYSFLQLSTCVCQNVQHQISQEYTRELVRNICILSHQVDNVGSNTYHWMSRSYDLAIPGLRFLHEEGQVR